MNSIALQHSHELASHLLDCVSAPCSLFQELLERALNQAAHEYVAFASKDLIQEVLQLSDAHEELVIPLCGYLSRMVFHCEVHLINAIPHFGMSAVTFRPGVCGSAMRVMVDRYGWQSAQFRAALLADCVFGAAKETVHGE